MHIMAGPPVLTSQQADILDESESINNVSLSKKGLRRHCVQQLYTFRLPGPIVSLDVERPSNHHPLGFGHNYNSY